MLNTSGSWNVGRTTGRCAACRAALAPESICWAALCDGARLPVKEVAAEAKSKDKKEQDPFEEILHHKKEKAGVKFDSELNPTQLKELVAEFKKAIKDRTGHDFPTDPMTQLRGAIGAVFGSWMRTLEPVDWT